jgi:DNA-binding CsgD family transcriptional regulator
MQAHWNHTPRMAPKQEASGHRRKLLLVGRRDAAKNDSILRLFNLREVQVIGRTTSLLEALRRLQAEAVDLVLLGSEFRGEESSLFLLTAQAHGFVGLVLSVMPAAEPVTRSNPPGESSPDKSAEGVQGEDKSRQRSINRSGNRSAARRGVSTQLEILPPQTEKLDEFFASTPLTTRQRTVLKRVSDGWSSIEIARSLRCSEGSVKATLQQLFRKLGVRKRILLARMASEGTRTNLDDGKSF